MLMKAIFLRSLLIGTVVGLIAGLWLAFDSYAQLHYAMQDRGSEIYQAVSQGNMVARQEAETMLAFAQQPRSFMEIMFQSTTYTSFWVLFAQFFIVFFLVGFLAFYGIASWKKRHEILNED